MRILKYCLAASCFIFSSIALADIVVPMYFTAEKGTKHPAGTIIIAETSHGLLFTPDLHGLKPGVHGFHIHEHASCEEKGMAAGGHLDPKKTDKHLGPYNKEGHLGDLPALYANADGRVTVPVLTPRIKDLDDIKNMSLMIHDHGDNYSDVPEKLGGGGARMVCGVIK